MFLQFKPYLPPMEPVVCLQAAFSAEECDRIRAIAELQEFQEGSIGGGAGQPINGVVDHGVRKTDLVWLHPNNESDWVFQRIGERAARVNYDKFQMQLTQFDGFQYGRYRPEHHYDWHVDTHNNPVDGLYRKLSISILLSTPDEYDGGDLLFAPDGRQEEDRCQRYRPAKGDMTVFYSHVAHKVTPVTRGERVSLVTWIKGDKPQ